MAAGPFWLKIGSHPTSKMFFVLWLLCNVSCTKRCNAFWGSERPEAPLHDGSGGVDCLHRSVWRSGTRPTSPGRPADQRDWCLFVQSPIAWRHSPLRGASCPCGISLEPGEEDPSCEKRWRLGQLGICVPLCREQCDEGYGFCHYSSNSSNNFKLGAKDQDEPSFGPERRLRGSCRDRGHEGFVVSALHHHHWRLAHGRGGANDGADKRIGEEDQDPEHCSICGLWSMGPLWTESSTGLQIQIIHFDLDGVHHQRPARTLQLCPVASLLQGSSLCSCDAGLRVFGGAAQLRDADGKDDQVLPVMLAPGVCCRRTSKVSPLKQDPFENRHGHQGWQDGSYELGREQTLGLRFWTTMRRRRFLASSGAYPCLGMDGCRKSRPSTNTSRSFSHGIHAGGYVSDLPSRGSKAKLLEAISTTSGLSHKVEKRGKETESRFRQGRTSPIPKWKWGNQGQEEQHEGWQAIVLWLEQWKWTMRGIAAWATMRVTSSERTQMHDLSEPRTPKQILSFEIPEENMRKAAENQEDEKGKKEGQVGPSKKSASSSSSYYTYTEDDQGEQEGDDGEEGSDEDPNAPHISNAKTIEEYLACRTFIYVHHFAGKNDPLGAAIKEEAEFQSLKVKVISVEKDKDTGDLLLDEPYNTHYMWAQRGYIDGYHSGFPCSTFSRLRFRDAPGLPKPVRTKLEPYGKKENNLHQQRECDDGTVLCCRSINMAKAVATRKQKSTVKPPTTMENPPPSNHPDHLSAWELPEMKKFLEEHEEKGMKVARFNTCAYEPHLKVGSKHFKPQQFVGSLLGMDTLCKTCNCGQPSNHEAIVGKEKSSASGEYPKELCAHLARLIVTQFKLMAREEWLKRRMTKLEITITEKKEELRAKEERSTSDDQGSQRDKSYVTPSRTTKSKTPSAPRKRRRQEDRGGIVLKSRSPSHRRKPIRSRSRGCSSSPPRPSSAGRRTGKRESRSRSAPARRVKLEEAKSPDRTWTGGEGKYGMLKRSKAKSADPKQMDYIGGMRHPFKVVQPLSNLMTTGLRVRAAWESFIKQHPKAIKVAEDYGTKDCNLDERMVNEWKSRLRKTLGAKAPPKLKVLPKYVFRSPLDAELFEAWINKANDPDVYTPSWIRDGVPLGIEREIPTANIFPTMGDDSHLDHLGPDELEDAAGQLAKGSIENYVSVKDKPQEALIELERYRSLGYIQDVDEHTVKTAMSKGTISKLGLILKEKPEGIKRRIILDLRRSGGNKKSTLPERLVLPRPQDALASFREVYAMRKRAPPEEKYARELVVIDISDAFMSLGLHQDELPHALAPKVNSSGFYVFGALLFGYKTAPLLWSRVAAQVSRFLQSLLQGDEGMHQTYLDDALWILQGGLKNRNENLAMLLTTMAALGLKVATKKGERSSQVQWIGVRFSLSQDHVIMSLPEKYTAEVLELLEGWNNKGMATIAELRRACGKLSWLSGILPRCRWIVATFYRVLHERLRDISTGEEDRRRTTREDKRSKDTLFAVKQLEQARQWMVTFLKTAMEQPAKKYKLDMGQYPKATIMTDASPNALGAILLVNNKMIRAISVKVTKAEATELGFGDRWNTSACQGIMEALAVLVALKHWNKELASCQVLLQIQSDSLVALALTQRLGNNDPSLNYIGAETAVECEKGGIERLQAGHVPGTANNVADYLSRPEEWDNKSKPSELQNFPITKLDVTKDQSFYSLPTPASNPELWRSSAAANEMWASIR